MQMRCLYHDVPYMMSGLVSREVILIKGMELRVSLQYVSKTFQEFLCGFIIIPIGEVSRFVTNLAIQLLNVIPLQC